MMTINKVWFYAQLALMLCGGAGLGAFANDAYFSDSVERAKAIKQAQLEALHNCQTFEPDTKPLAKGEFRNSRGQGF